MYTTRPVMKKRGRPPTEETLVRRQVIERLLKEPSKWEKEIKVMRELYYQYPDIEFWKGFNLGFKLNSFYWFKSDKGKQQLELSYKEFKKVVVIPDKIEYIIDNVKHGEDAVIEKKPKTLSELFK